MSELDPREVMVLAILASPAGLDPAMANRVVDYVEVAFKLQSLDIVPGAAPAAITVREGETPPRSPTPRVQQPRPEVWPKLCSRCHKVINTKADADACDQSACPI